MVNPVDRTIFMQRAGIADNSIAYLEDVFELLIPPGKKLELTFDSAGSALWQGIVIYDVRRDVFSKKGNYPNGNMEPIINDTSEYFRLFFTGWAHRDGIWHQSKYLAKIHANFLTVSFDDVVGDGDYNDINVNIQVIDN